MNEWKYINDLVPIMDLVIRTGYKVHSGNMVSSPFRDEKIPSVKINIDTNTWHDFGGTGDHGGPIDWWMAVYGLNNADALKDLQKLYNVIPGDVNRTAVKPIVRQSVTPFDAMSEEEKYYYYERLGILSDSGDATSERKALVLAKQKRINKNSEIYHEIYDYTRHKRNRLAWEYLTKARKLPEDILNKKLITTVDNYYELNNHLKKRFDIDDLYRSGLFSESGNLIFYSYRILIPYLHNNNIIYVRGRYFDEKGNDSPQDKRYGKYLGLKNDGLGVNSPKRFYNWDVVKSLVNGERLFILEGEFDALVVESFEHNAIAVPGVNNLPGVKYDKKNKKYIVVTTELKLIRQLLRLSITVCADNDDAGNHLVEQFKVLFAHFDRTFKVKTLKEKDANKLLEVYG